MTQNGTHDPLLQELFREASHELDGEAFTDRVMAGTQRIKRKVAIALLGATLGVLACVWLFALPLQEFGIMVARGLMTPLFQLGEGWLSWAITPINTVGSLLVVLAKVMRVAWKKARGAFYTN